MKRKAIPAFIMLIGGFCSCIIGILNHMDTAAYNKMLIIMLIVFYILGCIAKTMIDKMFPEMSEKEKAAEEDGAEADTEENMEDAEALEATEEKEE